MIIKNKCHKYLLSIFISGLRSGESCKNHEKKLLNTLLSVSVLKKGHPYSKFHIITQKETIQRGLHIHKSIH